MYVYTFYITPHLRTQSVCVLEEVFSWWWPVWGWNTSSRNDCYFFIVCLRYSWCSCYISYYHTHTVDTAHWNRKLVAPSLPMAGKTCFHEKRYSRQFVDMVIWNCIMTTTNLKATKLVLYIYKAYQCVRAFLPLERSELRENRLKKWLVAQPVFFVVGLLWPQVLSDI